MTKIKKILALVLSICILSTVGIVSVGAATADEEDAVAANGGITVHYYSENGAPNIYYWNSLHSYATPRPVVKSVYRLFRSYFTKITKLFETYVL